VVRQSAGSSQSFVQLAERRSSLREAQEAAALGLRALLALAASATALPTAKVVEALAHGRCTPTAGGTSAWEARAAVGRALCVLASLAIGRGEVKVGKQYAEMGVQVSRSAAVSHCETLMPAAHWLTARRRSVRRPPSLRAGGLERPLAVLGRCTPPQRCARPLRHC
jgi:hypothetical protein